MDTINNLDEQERQRLTRICWLYYIEELTHKEIGTRLGLSRVKITRLLRQARDQGIVRINIAGANSKYFHLEHSLCETFGLQDAVVVMEAEQGSLLYHALAQGAAEWLAERLEANMLIGLSLGRTISHLPDAIQAQEHIQTQYPLQCGFTEVMGGTSEGGRGFASYSVVSRMAQLTGGQAHYIYAPTVVSNPELRTLLVQENAVAEALERARSCHIALHSVGVLNEDALLYQNGYISDEDISTMRQAGAIGNVLNHFIDQDGQLVPNPVEERSIGLSLEDIRNIPLSVCISGGLEKAKLVHAALQSNLFNVLIIDAGTAQWLLNQ